VSTRSDSLGHRLAADYLPEQSDVAAQDQAEGGPRRTGSRWPIRTEPAWCSRTSPTWWLRGR